MKYHILLFALFLSLYSCSIETSVPDNYEHQGTWELVRTRSNMAHAAYEDPQVRESYTFRNNGTFLKTRLEGASEETAEGTYKLVNRPWNGAGEPLLFLELKFDTGIPMVSNCTVDPVENLIITSEYLLINTWVACDGFLMEYEKTEPSEN
ncbi:MAG: hypothetical protein R3209_09485 [Salinimicrobium sediminis]|nr:hypothetical protein [Salinimicrobium sediminis]MDX1751651.1 hypothetical protein [Salinimicrobium sediminis]